MSERMEVRAPACSEGKSQRAPPHVHMENVGKAKIVKGMCVQVAGTKANATTTNATKCQKAE